MPRPPFYWYHGRVAQLSRHRKKIKNPRKVAAWEWYHKLKPGEKKSILKRDHAKQAKYGRRLDLVPKAKRKKTRSPAARTGSLSPYYVGGNVMAKKKKSKKSGGYKVTHSVTRVRGQMGYDGPGVRGALNFLGTFLLTVFGAATASFVANKVPAKIPGSRHVKALLPAGLGVASSLLIPRRFQNIVFPAACGAYAVSGVSMVKTYLPGVPLLAGDANALQVPEYTIGQDEEGRLIDTRDGSLLLDEQGRTLGANGEPIESVDQFEGEPGDMLGQGPGEMLGEDESVEMVGEENEYEDIFA